MDSTVLLVFASIFGTIALVAVTLVAVWVQTSPHDPVHLLIS